MEALRPRQDPERIGTYAVLARLGAGGMGMVYLGRSPGGRLVAIKVIKDEITDHPEALARFRREAETVRAVRGAYTANLIDASLETAPYWLATEYVAGPTLSQAVRERGAFPADTCRRLFAALAEGLASVHAYGVTHRDLKPQNVILSPQGPQLIDFGIAKGATDTALTQTGLAPGTPGFTAPEVLMSNQVGAAADVFALGATIAFAATGRAPFGAGPMDAVSYRAVHEEIDTEGVETGLAGLIRACAAKDPAERPDPAEVIVRCAVSSALVEDPHYQSLASLAEEVPATALRAPHELPTQGPGYAAPAPSHPGYVPTLAPQGPTAARPAVPRARCGW
ncbi:serine/threonine-protein kinase [Streptomyces sp. NPDC056682]|uniref:serine/threonine-protein kinase n=1 Tax=Streptomyces sp. NPDC056682 TaxID=3345909 RepID=UPI0036D06F67